MYKLILILSITITLGSTAKIPSGKKPIDEKEIVSILRSASETEPDGSYAFSYEGADGTSREERGIVINPDTEDSYIAVSGRYKYIDSEGETIDIHYTADDKGFVPEGGNIPASISRAARTPLTTEQ